MRSPGGSSCATGEVRDGAHTPEAVDWLLERLPEPRDYVVVASILGDKDADGILERLARAGRHARRDPLVERRGRCPRRRSPPARGTFFDASSNVDDPAAALARARELGRAGARHRLALPACRSRRKTTEMHTMSRSGERISVFLFALVLLALFVGLAFAAGYALGRILL